MPNKNFVYNNVYKIRDKKMKKKETSHLLIGQLHDDDIWLQLPAVHFGFALLFKFVNPDED